MLSVEVLTLFPRMVELPLAESILGKAQQAGLLRVRALDVRQFAEGKHRATDYGEADQIHNCDSEKTELGREINSRALALSVFDGRKHQRGQASQGQDIKIEISKGLPDA